MQIQRVQANSDRHTARQQTLSGKTLVFLNFYFSEYMHYIKQQQQQQKHTERLEFLLFLPPK